MFELSHGNDRNKVFIGKYRTEEEARAEMVRQLTIRNIQPLYYYRYIGEPNNYAIDYGSWSSYYYIKEVQN